MAPNGFSLPILWRSSERGNEAGGGEAGREDRAGEAHVGGERKAGRGHRRPGGHRVDFVAKPRGVLTAAAAAAGGIRLLTIPPICPPPLPSPHPLLPI